jgi:hypothetical protein
MVRPTARFAAVAADGTEYVIHVYTGYVLAHPLDGPPELLAEEPEFRTACGLDVEKVGPGAYLVVSTGLLLRSADPASL